MTYVATINNKPISQSTRMRAMIIIKGNRSVKNNKRYISFNGIGYVAYRFYGLFADIRIKEQNYGVLESTMTECSV